MCADWNKPDVTCTCRRAVLRTYEGLTRCGKLHPKAAEAADRVFRWHHPEMTSAERKSILADWLHRGASERL